MSDEFRDPNPWAVEPVFDVPEHDLQITHPLEFVNTIAWYLVPGDASRSTARKIILSLALATTILTLSAMYLQYLVVAGELSLSTYIIYHVVLANLIHIPCFLIYWKWGFKPYQVVRAGLCDESRV